MINVIMMRKITSKAESGLREHYEDILDGYKERERQHEEREATYREANENQSSRLDEERKIIKEREKNLAETKKTIDLYVKKNQRLEEQLAQQKEVLERQELIIRHLKGEK